MVFECVLPAPVPLGPSVPRGVRLQSQNKYWELEKTRAEQEWLPHKLLSVGTGPSPPASELHTTLATGASLASSCEDSRWAAKGTGHSYTGTYI